VITLLWLCCCIEKVKSHVLLHNDINTIDTTVSVILTVENTHAELIVILACTESWSLGYLLLCLMELLLTTVHVSHATGLSLSTADYSTLTVISVVILATMILTLQ